ncbi:MAG: hypothetical protein HYW93_06410, partial [Thaumarchaeota archaeon]|nr:hypothetical protein [Nitrososphaerota archaeon]
MSTSWIFDQMDGQFEARLRRVTTSTRSTRSGEGEITVTNYVGVVETRFNFVTLDRLYNPNFVAVERPVGGDLAYLIFEVVSVNPMHFQMLGMDVSMPTVLRREYLDTISESWGRSQETWIDLSAVPTWYMLRLDGADPTFERSKFLPLAGAKVHLLSKKAVEKFLCYESGENLGSMIGFDLPFTVNLENLIRYHAGLFGFSVDYDEPIIYRENGEVKISKIGRLVDKFYQRGETGPVRTSSIEVVCFDPQTLRLKWSPLQYVFRHEYRGKMLK